VLTWELLNHADQVVAVELDRRLADRLRQEFADQPKLTIVQSDILNLTPEQVLERRAADVAGTEQKLTEAHPAPAGASVLPASNPLYRLNGYKVVANLPYAITSAALRHFVEARYKPALMVVLVQWEVAERIVAQPGDLSVLAHSIQIYAEPEIMLRVPAGSFVPAPAVDSAVLRLRVRPQPVVDIDVDALMRLIKSGFLQARKKLSNALPTGLAAMGARVEKARVVAALEAAGVDPNRRAETVTLAEWARVYHELFAGGGNAGD